MEIKERKIEGVYEIALSPFEDDRGFFMRTFDINIFKEAGLERHWVQENQSRSVKKGIIRGLHFQLPPFAETKMLRCIQGSILDVFVDLREGSPTFGQWDSIVLSAENKKMVFIPRGFAHGFCTMTAESEVVYKVDNFFSREHERGLRWNDPDLAIKWPTGDAIVSDKDSQNMSFQNFIRTHKSIKV